MTLSKVLFWDTDFSKIDWEGQASYVISKVVTLGTIEDWNVIKSYYGLSRIKEEMLKVRYLDKKTLNFLSLIFDVPKENFRCYTWMQSTPEHWSF